MTNYFSFNPFGNKSLILEFQCDVCSTKVVSEEIPIPYPDYSAESASDSQTEEEGYAICEFCDKQFDISIYSTYVGGDGSIEDLPKEYDVNVITISEPYYEEQYEAISSNTLFFETFKSELENIKQLNEIELSNASIDKTLRRQIYVGVIASMETYLSDAFINTTLSSQEFIKKFVSTFHEFKEKLVNLSQLFNSYERIAETCKQAMLEVIYHNLPKIKGMYKDTLSIDLGDIGLAYKAVLTRHDLVHRNGKTKDGKEVTIDKDTIEKLIADIETFIESIDEQIKSMK